ncbi:T9SS type A sorting domain-containing protein [Dyadobacter frigoris]|uniref:T9SS type A sorting domain-containing protein n=1 Tax=Dyadobacter frigoris TaxID=2576211 RepID=A0A4U6CS76_9BACT|nr:T9SS type A sorting domain-containing protein [Dyadobacter frigoris]TKT86535.1 T9SS type A sorting domain-containing protein [Dyadobacter frigoris]
MKKAFTLTAVFLTSTLISQAFAQNSINSAGGMGSSAEGNTVSYSIGQVFDQANKVSGISLIEGVQQPSEISLPLPVTLIYFKAALTTENQVQLSWSTASETNNDFFTVERSANAKKFYGIKTVPGNGNKSQISNYQVIDAEPLAGISYYRLKQTDKDQTFAYSKIASIKLNDLSNVVSTYPNPATDQIMIRLTKAPSKNCGYQLFYMDGKLLQAGDIKENMTVVNISHLTPGMYLLKIKETNYDVQTYKIVKM